MKKKYEPILKYEKENYLALAKFVQKYVNGIISSDLDYHMPFLSKKKYLGMIPNPINTQKSNIMELINLKKYRFYMRLILVIK